MLMAMCSFCNAREAYAVYTSGNRTLTFYYDNKRLDQPSTVYTYDVPSGNYAPDWIDGGKIDKVVFTSSFADYRPTSTYKWFYNQEDLDEIIGIDCLKTDNVTNMSYMFYGCYHLCHLDGVVNGIDNWNTGNVTDMSYMFYGCYALKSLNVGSWNTGNVTDMSWMFNGCNQLTSLDVSGWNTGKVTNMKAMFAECKSLKSLDLRKWDTSKVTDMSWMFYYCKSLEYNFPLNSWNTGKVANMSGMFSTCQKLENIELNEWDTSNVTDMSNMFWECDILTSLDLSGWNTGKVTNMDFMFYHCSGLTKIYVGNRWNTGKVSSSNGMFFNCYQLVGGSGTKYNSSHDDATYARIDGGTTKPGYFSENMKEYYLTIAGTQVKISNMSDVLGNGIFSYSPSKKTLTVKGSFTSDDADIICSDLEGLTIDVTQDAVLANNGARTSIWLKKNTTIKGEGKLTLKANDNPGIYLTDGASATIENMNMDIEAFWGISGPSNPTGEKITIKSSNITIITSTAGNQYAAAICDLPGGIILEDCSITYPANATIRNKGVYLGNSDNLAKDVTIKAKVGISTGIDEAMPQDKVQSESWYTIDGRKLNGKPNAKGIYVKNGRKVVVN